MGFPITVTVWGISDITTCAVDPFTVTVLGGFNPPVLIPF